MSYLSLSLKKSIPLFIISRPPHHLLPSPLSSLLHLLVPLLAGRGGVRPRLRGLVTPLAGPSLGRGYAIRARAPSATPRTHLSSQRCYRPRLPSTRRLPRPLDATDASPPSVRRQRVTDDVVCDTADAAIASRCAAPRWPLAGGPTATQGHQRTLIVLRRQGGTRVAARGKGNGGCAPRRGGSSGRRDGHERPPRGRGPAVGSVGPSPLPHPRLSELPVHCGMLGSPSRRRRADRMLVQQIALGASSAGRARRRTGCRRRRRFCKS